MKKLIGSLLLFAVLAISTISCGGDTPAETPKDGEKVACCASKEKCDHKAADACKKDCAKPCCANNDEQKTCNKGETKSCKKDSATCASFKAKCNTECGTDSVICDAHKAECKTACAAKGDSTSVNNCAADCTKPCCSGEEKTACAKDCKKECCTAE